MLSLRQLIQQDSNHNLLDLLSSLCQGSIAVDEQGLILWMSDAYRSLINVPEGLDPIGRPVEELLPTTQLPRVVQSGKPSFVDLMQINNRWCVVTRLPIRNPENVVLGAIGFVFYDDLDSLQPLFDKFARLRRKFEDEKILRPSRYALDDMIGSAPATEQLRRQALRAAQLDTTLLLLGETGTGKELLAQGIHHASPRRAGPFVGINMGALPESLVESELFGSAPGAYTGANRAGRVGKIQLADGGTLFLDEIAEMPLTMQAKLLRVLQEREVEALGSNQLQKVDVRIIAATAKDLKQLVQTGEFREDLYYRLNVLPIQIPPLRERLADLPELTEFMLTQIQRQSQLPELSLSATAMEWLTHYRWPGNIRELRNRLERGCVMAEGQQIEALDLGSDDEAITDADTDSAGTDLKHVRMEAEYQRIQQAITQCNGNKTAAAKRLGISRASLYQKLSSHR
ncbi:sigma 54-interacting transcriptional regulator [uncultured Neptuniibacter sp.]|uniref:sigma-54 interaction domain-containing protein n=1 Tax=uncultured Neptuniibacter sp. TaxID=502143 RepID=UPI002632CDC1|nr:sigma 54-interacting transcriptional regulator [uncultured Neptuniibacter sp.]